MHKRPRPHLDPKAPRFCCGAGWLCPLWCAGLLVLHLQPRQIITGKPGDTYLKDNSLLHMGAIPISPLSQPYSTSQCLLVILVVISQGGLAQCLSQQCIIELALVLQSIASSFRFIILKYFS